MRRVILLEHVSLDGFAAGPNGEMDWIKLANEQWDRVTEISDAADAALYGRVTYQMMESYWPTAGDQPGASQHDKDHGRWLSTATKYVFSKTLQSSTWEGTQILAGDVLETMNRIKQGPGKDIFLLGSPSLARTLNSLGLIDDYWLYLNPVILGEGLPLFEGKSELDLLSSKPLSTGVIELHYQKA